jgi:hypothetical protein
MALPEDENAETNALGPFGRILEFLLTVRIARLALAVAGFGGLTAGALIAWRANSATPLLVISGIFVALALVEWEELTLTRGELTAKLSRPSRRIERLVAREDIPVDAKLELAEAATEVAAVADESRGFVGRRHARRAPLLGEVIVGHAIREDSVTLTLETQPLRASLGCTVRGPSASWTALVDTPASVIGGINGFWATYKVTFPDDFTRTPFPLEDGSYVAVWTYGRERVAEDEFRVPTSRVLPADE